MRPDFISMLKPKVKGIVIWQQLPVNAHNRQTTVLHYLREKEFRSLLDGMLACCSVCLTNKLHTYIACYCVSGVQAGTFSRVFAVAHSCSL